MAKRLDDQLQASSGVASSAYGRSERVVSTTSQSAHSYGVVSTTDQYDGPYYRNWMAGDDQTGPHYRDWMAGDDQPGPYCRNWASGDQPGPYYRNRIAGGQPGSHYRNWSSATAQAAAGSFYGNGYAVGQTGCSQRDLTTAAWQDESSSYYRNWRVARPRTPLVFSARAQPTTGPVAAVPGNDAAVDNKQYLEPNDFKCFADAKKYKKLMKVGHGSFGEVFKAVSVSDPSKIVAMKTILMDDRTGVIRFPKSATREIRVLKFMKHENIVRLIDFCRTQTNYTPYSRYDVTFYLVFEFCDHDLAGLLFNINVRFRLSDIKEMLKQLLNSLYYIHQNSIIHRDFKAANVLITKYGIMKLADFGLSRIIPEKIADRPNTLTNRVVTLWFRSPELLLGDCDYGTAVDLWGFGCVMAEMWTRYSLFQGVSEQTQLTTICELCGSITPDVWPDVVKLYLYGMLNLPVGIPRKVKETLRPFIRNAYGCDLVDRFLALDPKKRINADMALNHPFFRSDPMPSKPEGLVRMLTQLKGHCFEYLSSTTNVRREFSNSHINNNGPLTIPPLAPEDYFDP